jgi:tetratricopeptide (TPR) repeat protein
VTLLQTRLVAGFVAVVSMACTQPGTTTGTTGTSAASRAELRPVTLPDLSKMVEPVQRQLRERHQSLTTAAANASTPPAELAASYGEMGKLLMAAQYAEAAEASFLNAQTLAASDFRWPYYLAHLARTQGDLPKARTLFERAVQLQPTDVAALVWLGDIALAMGQPEAAEPQFAKALGLQPNSISARFGLGRTALARNQPQEAVTYLEDVLTRDPKAASAHYPLSLAYTALGSTKKADEHLRQRREHDILPADPLIVELDSILQGPQTFETLGIRALNGEDWNGAAAQFRKGLALAPDNASLHHRLGTALNMLGDAKSAEAEFETAVRLAPDYFPAQFSLGVIRQAIGRHADAIEHFSEALRARANYPEARVRLAASLRRVGRAQEALPQYEQVLAVDPSLTEARFGSAMALVQLGRYQEARDMLNRATQAYPDQIVFAHGLARVLAASPDGATRDGQRALTLVQDLMKHGRTLDLGETTAMALAEVGQFAQASSIQRELMAAAETSKLTTVVARLSRNLQLYEQRQPCRTPWAADEIP